LVDGRKLKIVDLTYNSNSEEKTSLRIALNAQGHIKGSYQEEKAGLFAAFANEWYQSGSFQFIKKYVDRFPFSIGDPDVQRDKGMFTFSFKVDAPYIKGSENGEMRFQPLLFTKNEDFQLTGNSIRKTPINFRMKQEKMRNVEIGLPENYELISLPKSIVIKTEDNALVYTYEVTKRENTIKVSTNWKINTIQIPKENAEGVKQFFEKIRAIEAQEIVIKPKK